MPYIDRKKPANRTKCSNLTADTLGVFYMHYHIDMIMHGTFFDEPVGGTGLSKLATCRSLASEQGRSGANQQSSSH